MNGMDWQTLRPMVSPAAAAVAWILGLFALYGLIIWESKTFFLRSRLAACFDSEWRELVLERRRQVRRRRQLRWWAFKLRLTSGLLGAIEWMISWKSG